ncbi:hypothetical protein [Actibacterium mucosum]|uniref:hypothetical protein n=1 Tax=Actibacterium mucosum TaxID=1087332 RepID=UPI00126975AB|nr:hypothetical protein [Actibacterium mucosum]
MTPSMAVNPTHATQRVFRGKPVWLDEKSSIEATGFLASETDIIWLAPFEYGPRRPEGCATDPVETAHEVIVAPCSGPWAQMLFAQRVRRFRKGHPSEVRARQRSGRLYCLLDRALCPPVQ